MLKFNMQIDLVYLQPFRRHSGLKCALQPEIAIKSLKTSILAVQSRLKSSMSTNLKTC